MMAWLRGRRRSTWALVAITALALVVRLVVAVRYAHVVGYRGGDQRDYQTLAFDIIGGNGYRAPGGGPTAGRSPGYPLFLAAVIRVGHLVLGDVSIREIVGLAQALVGSATVAVTGVLGRRLVGPLVGVVAAAVVAVWPSLVLMTSIVLTETLFTLLLVTGLAIAFWVEVPGERRLRWAGFVLGLAALTRPAALPVVLAVAVVMLVVAGARRWDRRRSGAVLVGLTVALTPWIFRNVLEMGTFVPTDLHGGFALCQSNRPGAGPSDPNDPYCEFRGENEVVNDTRLRNQALRWMATHPASEASLIVRRAGVIMRGDSDIVDELDPPGSDPHFSSGAASWWRTVADGFWWVVLLPAVVGVVLLVRRPRTRWLTVSYLTVMVLPLLITVEPRLHQPLAPLLALGAGVTVQAVGRTVVDRRKPLPGAS